MTEIEKAMLKRCDALGYRFPPWSPTPWEVHTAAPPAWAAGTAWARAWPRVFKLRQKLESELELNQAHQA